MNRKDIIRMAREAGLWETRHSVEMALGGVGELERFAVLVASAEREACAKYIEQMRVEDTPLTTVMGALGDAIRARGQA